VVLLAISLCPISSHASGEERERDPELRHIKHIVVIYQENWSFDSLYGLFPGANGLAQSSSTSLNQTDRFDQPLSAQNRAAVQPGIRIADADHAAATDQLRANRYELYSRTQYPASL
jgi:phospholipase C